MAGELRAVWPFPTNINPMHVANVTDLVLRTRGILQRSLVYAQQDAQIKASVTVHNVLPAAEQAVHDKTVYDSERLVTEIPAAIAAIDDWLRAQEAV